MHLQHMALGFLARVAEDSLEHHCHITHQIDRIVVHHHLSWKVDIFFRTRFFFDRGLINCRRPRIFRNRKPHNRHDFLRRHFVPKRHSGHIEKANIRHLQFKPDPPNRRGLQPPSPTSGHPSSQLPPTMWQREFFPALSLFSAHRLRCDRQGRADARVRAQRKAAAHAPTNSRRR